MLVKTADSSKINQMDSQKNSAMEEDIFLQILLWCNLEYLSSDNMNFLPPEKYLGSDPGKNLWGDLPQKIHRSSWKIFCCLIRCIQKSSMWCCVSANVSLFRVIFFLSACFFDSSCLDPNIRQFQAMFIAVQMQTKLNHSIHRIYRQDSTQCWCGAL